MGQCKSSEPKQGACKHGESCNNDSCRNGEHKSSTKQNASPEHDDYYNSNTASGESLGVGAASSRRSSGGLTLTGADSGGGGAEDHHKGGPPEGSPMTAKYSGGGRGRGGSVMCGFEQQETQSTGFGWDESRNQSFSSIPMGPRNDTVVYEPSPMLFHKKPMFPNVNATPAQSDYTPSRPRSLLGVLGGPANSPPPSHGGEQEHAITFASRRGERKQKTGEAGSPTTFLLLSGEADAGDDTRKDGDCTSEDVPTTREPSLEQEEEREDPNSSKFLRVNCVEPRVPEQQQQPRDSRISTAEGDIDGFPVLNRENTAALQQDLLSEDRESSCQLENVKSWLTTVNSEGDFFFGEGCAPQNSSGPGITGSTESFGSSNPQTSSLSLFNSGGGTNGIERSRTLSFGPGQRQISTISAEMSPGCCVTVAVGTLNSNSTLVSGETGTNESTEGVADPWDPTNFTPGLSVVLSGVGSS